MTFNVGTAGPGHSNRAAKKLQKAHAGLAARLWCAQGVRIVKAGKSTTRRSETSRAGQHLAGTRRM
jgi:hypothetical protein